MDKLTRHKILCTCDSLLESIENPTRKLRKSQADKWPEKEDDNPYFSHVAQTKRMKKYVKRLRKEYKEMITRFNERYAQAQPFSLYLRPFKKAEPFSDEKWAEIVGGVIVSSELFQAFEETFVEELDIAFREVAKNVVTVHNLGVAESSIFVPQDVLTEFRNYELKFSQATAAKIDTSISDIIFYGLEDGLSNDNIAKAIVSKFQDLSKYQALRISRTETIRASARGTMSAYDRLGVEEYEILPARDACPICVDAALANPYPIKDVGGRPPLHPNCRCTVIPVVKTDNQQ